MTRCAWNGAARARALAPTFRLYSRPESGFAITCETGPTYSAAKVTRAIVPQADVFNWDSIRVLRLACTFSDRD